MTSFSVPWLLLAVVSHGPVPRVASHVPAEDARVVPIVTVLRGDVRWAGHRTHRLSGLTVLAPGSSLTIEPGAMVLANPGAALVVPRDARIDAQGTLLEPIVFTCDQPVPFAGCWGGVTIAGNAPINHGVPTSPIPRGQPGASGCLEYPDDVTPYGGCPFADSSGVLRFVRIEYSNNGLRLLGVGATTVIDKIQVHRSLGDGLQVVGGRVDVRYVALTANAQYGLHWTGGWGGRGQHLIIQGDPSFVAGGILGQNGGVSNTSDDAVPRSQPSIANVTVVLESSGANPYNVLAPRALVLERGTAGDLRDLIVYKPAVALDVVGASACNQLAGGFLRLRSVVTAGATSVGPTGIAAQSCGPYAGPVPEAQWLADATAQNVVVTNAATVATLVLSGTNIVLPDLRPAFDSPAAMLPVTGGGGAFFDATTWLGGVPPAQPAKNNVPWYSGWTIGEVLAIPALASLSGTVVSAIRGPLSGVTVTLEPSQRFTTSGVGGGYALSAMPPGPVVARLSTLPSGCTVPPPESFTLLAGALATRDLGVPCTPATEVALDAGARHTCALTMIGEAHCWGSNDRGQLGMGSGIESRTPTRVIGTATYQAIAASNVHTCALTSARAVQCWGGNSYGQLGLADTLDRTLPTTVPGGPYVAVVAGAEHSCALSVTGVVSCWGQNSSGQLGTGNTQPVRGPVIVSAPLPFVGVTAGGLQSCGWTAVGTAYCWGSNITGALGTALPFAYAPTPVTTGLLFTSLQAGESYTCGVTTAAQGTCWGTNSVGQLGVGSIGNQPFPQVIAGNPITRSIGASAEASILSHSCAVVSGGAAWCWGHNGSGQLGTETTAQCIYAVFQVPCTLSPLPVDGGLTFSRVVTGASHTCGLTLSRELWCWGSNSAGQLGDGGSGSTLLPVKVAGQLDLP